MNLYFTYENIKQKISVPDNTDFSVMIESFYQDQVLWAKKHGKDTSVITKKTPQQILTMLGNIEKENYNEFVANNVQPLMDEQTSDENEIFEEGFPLSLMEDLSQQGYEEKETDVIELHNNLITHGMTEEQYQLIIRCISRHEEETLEDIADNMGIELSALTMRLQRAKKKFETITGCPLVF